MTFSGKTLSTAHKEAIRQGMLQKGRLKRKLVKITVIIDKDIDLAELCNAVEKICGHKGIMIKVIE